MLLGSSTGGSLTLRERIFWNGQHSEMLSALREIQDKEVSNMNSIQLPRRCESGYSCNQENGTKEEPQFRRLKSERRKEASSD